MFRMIVVVCWCQATQLSQALGLVSGSISCNLKWKSDWLEGNFAQMKVMYQEVSLICIEICICKLEGPDLDH